MIFGVFDDLLSGPKTIEIVNPAKIHQRREVDKSLDASLLGEGGDGLSVSTGVRHGSAPKGLDRFL